MMIDVQQVLRRGAGVLAAMGLGLICGQALGTTQPENGAREVVETPKLVVVIAIDQLRRDRLFESSEAGLGRLKHAGRVFTAGQLAHGITTTCPGHAAIMTGLNPARSWLAE